jgi:ribosomal protein S30
VADYGVNIRVGVQGQSNARQLGEQIKEIVRGLENADKAFTKFSNNLKSFDQRRAQRAINDELDKTAEKYRILDRLQRQLLANDNSGIKAAQKRANLEEHISKTISAGRMRRQAAFLRGDPAQYPSGANQPFAPDPMVAIKKQRDAEKKFAREIFDIEQDFARKHNATQIDLLLDRTKREMDLQKDLFDNAIRLTKQEGKDFDKELKRRTQARKVAGEAIRLTGQTSPIGGAVGIPGSPAALRAAERVERIKSAQGSALIGGAFPLLFGQGFGAAAGGAAGGFGGGMLGGSFGFGLSLVGTALGSAVDTFIADQSRLAESLSETTDVFASLEASGYQVSDSLKDVVARLKGQGRFAEAYATELRELERRFGPGAQDMLSNYNNANERLGDALSRLGGEIASFVIPAVTALTNAFAGIINLIPDIPDIAGMIASQTTIGMIPGTKEAVSDFVRNAQEVATTRTNMFGFAELSSADRKRLAKVKEKELQVEKAILDINRDQAVIAAKKDAQRRKALSFLREEQKLATQIANLQASALSAEARINTMRSAQALAGVSAMQTAKKADIKAQKQLQEGFLELVRAGKYDQSAIGQIFEQLRLVDVAQIKNEMQELSAVLMPFMSNQEITALTGTGANDTPVGALFSVLMNISKVRFDQQEKSFKTIQDLLDERIQTMNLETDILLAGSEADATRLQLQLELNEAKKEAIALGLNEVQTAELLAAVRNRATKLEEKRKKDKDPRVRMQEELDKLLEKEAQVELAALAIGDAFASSFRSIIDGTKSANEAIADMLSSVAEHFMDMATQIIAKQLAIIAYGLIMKALGVGLNPSQDGIGGLSIGSPSEFGGGNLFSQNLAGATGATFAEGGYVSGPTRALIGEGGEPEYIIPESKMRESMARYSRGARGSSVIPENGGGSGTMDASGGTAVTAPIDVRYTVERINSVDYVTADQFQQGMQQAANQGAKQGEQQTLKRLQMSSSTRKRLGM